MWKNMLAQGGDAFIRSQGGPRYALSSFWQGQSIGLDHIFFKFTLKFHYAKRRFSVTLKCRHMYDVLNIDEIKN
jgi:hypothetical protein